MPVWRRVRRRRRVVPLAISRPWWSPAVHAPSGSDCCNPAPCGRAADSWLPWSSRTHRLRRAVTVAVLGSVCFSVGLADVPRCLAISRPWWSPAVHAPSRSDCCNPAPCGRAADSWLPWSSREPQASEGGYRGRPWFGLLQRRARRRAKVCGRRGLQHGGSRRLRASLVCRGSSGAGSSWRTLPSDSSTSASCMSFHRRTSARPARSCWSAPACQPRRPGKTYVAG